MQARRVQAPHIANLKFVELFWKREQEKLAKMQEQKIRSNCRELAKRIFECNRLAKTSSGYYIAEKILWNQHFDLAHIRIDSKSKKLVKELQSKLYFTVEETNGKLLVADHSVKVVKK